MFGSMSSRFKPYTSKMVALIVAIAVMIFAWSNLFININANAATLEGVGNQVKGEVQKGIGTAQRNTGDLTDDSVGELKGAAKQAKGEVRQNVGTAQNKLDDAKDAVEDKSESLIDSVKDFFD